MRKNLLITLVVLSLIHQTVSLASWPTFEQGLTRTSYNPNNRGPTATDHDNLWRLEAEDKFWSYNRAFVGPSNEALILQDSSSNVFTQSAYRAKVVDVNTGALLWQVQNNGADQMYFAVHHNRSIICSIIYTTNAASNLSCVESRSGKVLWSTIPQELGGQCETTSMYMEFLSDEVLLVNARKKACAVDPYIGVNVTNGAVLWSIDNMLSPSSAVRAYPPVFTRSGDRYFIDFLESSAQALHWNVAAYQFDVATANYSGLKWTFNDTISDVSLSFKPLLPVVGDDDILFVSRSFVNTNQSVIYALDQLSGTLLWNLWVPKILGLAVAPGGRLVITLHDVTGYSIRHYIVTRAAYNMIWHVPANSSYLSTPTIDNNHVVYICSGTVLSFNMTDGHHLTEYHNENRTIPVCDSQIIIGADNRLLALLSIPAVLMAVGRPDVVLPHDHDHHKLPWWAILLIVLAALAIVAGVVFFIRRRRRVGYQIVETTTTTTTTRY